MAEAKRATLADLAIGSRLLDNDPRSNGHVVTVTQLDTMQSRVGYQAGTRLAWIKIERIFTDGRTRHQGYNLVPTA